MVLGLKVTADLAVNQSRWRWLKACRFGTVVRSTSRRITTTCAHCRTPVQLLLWRTSWLKGYWMLMATGYGQWSKDTPAQDCQVFYYFYAIEYVVHESNSNYILVVLKNWWFAQLVKLKLFLFKYSIVWPCLPVNICWCDLYKYTDLLEADIFLYLFRKFHCT